MTIYRKEETPEYDNVAAGSRTVHKVVFVKGPYNNFCQEEKYRNPPYDQDNVFGFEQFLNMYADDGWELISHNLVPANPDVGHGISLIFRRTE